jgi:hypothetical protein
MGRPTFSIEISEISEAFRNFRKSRNIFPDFRKFRKIFDHLLWFRTHSEYNIRYGLFFLSWMFVESSRSVEVPDPAFRNALRILPKFWEASEISEPFRKSGKLPKFRNPSENFGTLPKFRNPSENFGTLPKFRKCWKREWKVLSIYKQAPPT